MDDRVDSSGFHDLREDRVVGVYPHILSSIEFDFWLIGIEANDDLDAWIGFEVLCYSATPEGTETSHQDSSSRLLRWVRRLRSHSYPHQTDRRSRSIS